MKKQLIMDNALELFAEKGIINTSVQEITDQCNISKGAFYLSFKSKNQLIQSIINQFMSDYIANNDQLVTKEPKATLLREFLRNSYRFNHKHRTFSKVYMKEHIHKMDEAMLERINYYDGLMNDIIYRLINKLYPGHSIHEKYELVYLLKSLMTLYQMFSFKINRELQIDVFVESISQKIELMANHKTKSFITDDILLYLQNREGQIEVNMIAEKINQLLNEVENPMINDSLSLLSGHLENQNLAPAIVQGLLSNIEKEPLCKEVAYLYKIYIEQQTSN